MKILFCTTEIHPYSKVGGLAEYSYNLTRALAVAGEDISVITPLYGQMDRSDLNLKPLSGCERVDLLLGQESQTFRYFESRLPDTEIPVYFAECEPLFGRDGIYTNPSDGKGFSDNHRRFGFFQIAVLHLMEIGLLKPEILHLNDHHTALIPAMIRSRPHSRAFDGIRTLLTLHNVSFQGDCPEDFAWEIGLRNELFEPDGPYRRNGRLNFLKAGVLFSDKVATVSMTYAEETRDDAELGYGLNEELAQRGEDYFGILNGVDYTDWNPRKDAFITKTYSPERLGQRVQNKVELLARNGLDSSNPDIPALGMITRLTDNKGFDMLGSVFDKLMTFDLNLIIVGTGEHKYHKLLESIKMRYPHKLGLNLTYSNKLAHEILAGTDFFLMPSRFEPCGQHQMFAMRYGSVPIVHATGGLADTVEDVSEDGREGWGFCFREYEDTALLKTVWRAISAFKDKRGFRKIVQRAMARDFSWDVTAEQYAQVYRNLLGI